MTIGPPTAQSVKLGGGLVGWREREERRGWEEWDWDVHARHFGVHATAGHAGEGYGRVSGRWPGEASCVVLLEASQWFEELRVDAA